MSPIPTLPSEDHDPHTRANQLARARGLYQYDFSNAGIVFVKDVPRGTNDRFSLRYLARAASINVLVAANELVGKAQESVSAVRCAIEGAETVHGRPPSLDVYAEAISLLPEPLGLHVWDEDWAFAWQRVAGESAHMLRQVSELPDHFAVTETHFERALGTRAYGDSLAGAIADGRAFLADYAMLDGVPNNTTGGVQHFMYAPLGLFCVEKTGGQRLMPVAIQCGQTPGRTCPIWTPDDGRRWTLAKQCFQVADMSIHGQVFHMGYCHTLLEAMIISSHRTLAPNHPLMVLLLPHFEFTLGANEVAKGSLVAAGGYVDQLLGANLDTENALVRDAVQRITWRDLIGTTEFEHNDTSRLSEYPWRDDSLLSWPTVLAFVSAYVALYYPSDQAVASDAELRAWLVEIGSDDGARLKHFVDPAAIATRDNLALLVAGIIFRATVYHAGINYVGYDWQLYAPNKSGAGYALAPTDDTVDHEDALRAMLPATELVYMLSKLLTQQRELKLTRMLRYEADTFSDPRVLPLLRKAQAELGAADDIITERNIRRPLVYELVSPGNVPNSIMV